MARTLRERLALARRVLDVHWFQPATALWRIYEVEVVRDHLRAGGRALDLGCGDGSLARALLDDSGEASWIGCDLDPREVILARRGRWHSALGAASAEALPLRAASLDLVFSNSALEHMDDLGRVLAEVSRVLRPGGRFVFTVPSASFHDALLVPRLLQAVGLSRHAERYLGHLDRRLRHLRYPSEREWEEALRRHGLAPRRFDRYLSSRTAACWEALSNLTGGLVHLGQRSRSAPRDAQLRAGLRPRPSRTLGALSFVLLSPVLLWTAVAHRARRTAGLYVEAERAGKVGL